MEDDELTRARRALHGVDPEIDLTGVYAESRARAHGAEAHEDWAPDEQVEIVLRGAGTDGRRTRRVVRRGPVLAWGAAAAAAVALVVSVAGLPTRTVPGSAPTSSVSATTDTGPAPSAEPSAEPTLGLTPSGVVDRAAQATADATCGVKTLSTLGQESERRYDEAGATDTATPKPTPLHQQPLLVLQTATVDAALDLSSLEGTDFRLNDDLTMEDDGGEILARIRLTPPDGLVPGGDVSRMELLVDTTTWLPRSGRTWAESDGGETYLVRTEFSWTTCAGPTPSTTDSPPPVNTDS
ncbi:hypothetical protein ACFT2C_24935 [Promicromonospora sp. NPDC057138]|uniref:hypothetical protein n=1 Tax=Promicromonospora sp. NPDC057138 TaxID=3346031 RepID=UPI003628C553